MGSAVNPFIFIYRSVFVDLKTIHFSEWDF